MASARGEMRVAVDVGGTFTDVCVLDEANGTLTVQKVPTTPKPLEGVLAGLDKAGVDLERVVLFSHGTTVATNALITRSFAPTVMITTRGFRDVIEIRRGTKKDLWDAYADVAPPYIGRAERLVVRESVDYAGNVVEPLDEEEALRIASAVRASGVRNAAICFINSFANAANEERMAEILREVAPDITVSLSSHVLPEIFEHERFSTTVANAVLAPLVRGYLSELESGLRERAYGGELVILHSGGGVLTARAASEFAVRLAGSGIAAGAIASRHIAGQAGYDNAIGFDMGGTSSDISIVNGGQLHVTTDWFVEFGYPIALPSIDVTTIGAGGGSLAWIDPAGALRSGPESAGSNPGPACYGQGNDRPTTTDANLVLGRLSDELIGGDMHLDRERAQRAVAQHVGERLGLGVIEAAHAIIQVANAKMADALRLVSVRRGYDPRDFALVTFGGAGPLHGAALAEELAIPTVLVPPNPGVTSAYGCLLVDVRHDLSAMYIAGAAGAEWDVIQASFDKLEQEGRRRLDAEGVPEERRGLERSIDMRYEGQWRSVRIPLQDASGGMGELVSQFHAAHYQEHGYRREGAAVELYRLNIVAIGATPRPHFKRETVIEDQAPPVQHRSVIFDGLIERSASVYQRTDLHPGARVDGPAVIDQLDSTVLIPPGRIAAVDGWRNLTVSKAGAPVEAAAFPQHV